MAQEEDVRGVRAGEEIKPSIMKRDHRTMKQKFSDSMGDPNGFMYIMGMYLSLLRIHSPNFLPAVLSFCPFWLKLISESTPSILSPYFL